MSKILITGVGGFIGKPLCSKLSKTKNEIVSLCKSNTNFDFGVKEIMGDINDSKLVKKLVSDVDVVIHLAAYLDVKKSFENLEEVYNTNVNGTFNFLKHISSLKNKPHFLFMSSSVVYGNTSKIPLKESQLLNPTTPYAMTKASSEMLCLGISNSYDVPLTILRPFSVYGPHAPSHQAIPKIISQIKTGNKLILDNPMEIRDFIYVDDVVDSIIKAIKHKPLKPKIYNVGSGKKVLMKSLANFFLQISNKRIKLIQGNITELNYKKSVADISLIKKELGWKPKTTLNEGISKIFQYQISQR